MGCFHLLAILNNAAVNMDIQISLSVPAFNVFERYIYISRLYIPRIHIPISGIAGSHSNYAIFNFSRNHHAVFQSGCTILHSCQQYTRDPVSPHLHWHLLFSVLFCFCFCFLAAPCGILVPWPGIEPVPPAVEAQSLKSRVPLDCQGSPILFCFNSSHPNGCEVSSMSFDKCIQLGTTAPVKIRNISGTP